jgi:hypothetical protein
MATAVPETGPLLGPRNGDHMTCQECNGSGACDPCDGYGTYPDSFPNAGDGQDCDICSGSGNCPDCNGTGETTNHNDQEMSA